MPVRAWAGVVLALAWGAWGVAAPPGFVLEARTLAGEVLMAEPVAEGTPWCLDWNHSVAGFLVRDCFRVVDGRMMLEESHQPDFAAGLGDVPGRGETVAAPGGGYRIRDMNEVVPKNCLRLRVGGPAVDHRIVLDGTETSLSARAARQSVRIVLRPEGQEGGEPC